MATLTSKQKQVLDYTREYILENGIAPTFEEIRRRFKLKAISTVHEHVEALTSKGFLSRNQGSSRGLELQGLHRKLVEIPLLGTIAAGQPIEAIENVGETVAVVSNLIDESRGHYALRVQGDSMIDEGIYNGDLVILKKQSVAENGQTVVAIIDDNEATLKKIYREKGRFRLQPANQALLPLYRDEVEIRGVVVQVIRNINKEAPAQTKPQTSGLKTLDLFAGVGGIRIGFERAGFNTVFANDFEPACKNTYDLNFPTSKLVVEDIRKIGINDLPEFDFILGGFPCQAFSIAGYREGFKDRKDRGNLFFDIARIIEARRPKGFLLENVKNLKSHDNGRTFQVIERELKRLGYHIRVKVLNSMEYGNVPQNRERIYMVGFKNKKYAEKFSFPDPVKLQVHITDLLERDVPAKYYYNGKPLYQKLKKGVTETGRVYQWRRQYVRENKKGVCPTLTANMGTGGHNVPIIKDKKGIRKLTPLECARIQGFPVDYKLPEGVADSVLYKQFGNSVTIPVIEAVARKMQQAMG